MNLRETDMGDMVRNMPVLPLRGLTVFPTMAVSFDISRESSIRAVEAAMEADQTLFIVTQKDPDMNNPGLRDLYGTGVIAKVQNVAKLPKQLVRVRIEGLMRGCLCLEAPYETAAERKAEAGRESALDRGIDSDKETAASGPDALKAKSPVVREAVKNEDCLRAQVALLEDEPVDYDEILWEAMARGLKDQLMRYGQLNQKFGKETVPRLLAINDLEKLVMTACVHIPLHYESRQQLLEAKDVLERCNLLSTFIVREISILEVQNEIQQKVKARVDKNQREYVLREQVRVIQEELGEDTLLADVRHYEEAAEKLAAPDAVKEKIHKEAERLKTIGTNSAESPVLRSYVETLLELPWDKASADCHDLKKARKILDEDHYGLEKVKERILEFLAVRSLTEKGDSPIICLVGPPGTGKTSIAQSIARALDKKFVRISLGGVRDEAEIRGHRRTYVGAMPGRIADGLKQAGVKNPLMLLDEIDKVSSDYKGDTSAALLEVLDSEQNYRFRDNYVELPLDLSEVLFLATANDAHAIPRPLLDRMEIIEVTSYTANEKLHIAREHLMKKQLAHNGLKKSQLTITKSAMESVIEGYTKEAGVRQLERRIGEICRKAALEILEDGTISVKVTNGNLEKYLGRKHSQILKRNKKNDVGIVRGLAWTSVGGDTLQIEVNTMPGKGEFLLTGQLGDVMKESARTAISYVRSLGTEYQIDSEFFTKNDIHIHIPEGAVPKDGPSAGITMATAILSAITQLPVRADVAMTGEITLRGRVLAIGGLKEKLLAAKQAGITTVLVPAENKPDVEEIQNEIKDGLKLKYVSSMPEVLKEALA
ncbi:MAG: endopeptidase La [Clostridiales bacterium]|nr:endopeptidase La [Clostridiales bacterium]